MKKTILVLFGGCSTEHTVSLQSACGVLSHLDLEKFTPLLVGITPDGSWLFYTGNHTRLAGGSWAEDTAHCIPCTLSLDRNARQLLLLDGSGRRLAFDGAFPVLHGKNGEDGTVQGLLELAGVPVIGCGALSSALCMDKHRAHALVSRTGIKVPRGSVFTPASPPGALAQTAQALGFPLFVKPVRSGSSFGITRVERPEDLFRAAQAAFAHDGEILLEEAVPGFEVGCAVLGNEAPETGLVDEIELSRGFFDYEEKYTLKTSAIHCPARIPPEKAEEIRETAKKIYRILGCRVFARVDLFLTPAGELVFNEVNTIPGFTAHSRYPGMMAEAGMDMTRLITRLIELGVGA